MSLFYGITKHIQIIDPIKFADKIHIELFTVLNKV